MNSNCL